MPPKQERKSVKIPNTAVVTAQDGVSLTIPKSLILHSQKLYDVYKQTETGLEGLPLPGVEGHQLQLAVNFFELYKKPVLIDPSTVPKDGCQQRPLTVDPAIEYLRKLSAEDFKSFKKVGSYLKSPTMLQYHAMTVCVEMEGLSTREMRKKLGLRDNYTEEQERDIEMRHEMCSSFNLE